MKETVDLVNDLKFFGIKESFEYRVKEAEESSLSHEEFFSLPTGRCSLKTKL